MSDRLRALAAEEAEFERKRLGRCGGLLDIAERYRERHGWVCFPICGKSPPARFPLRAIMRGATWKPHRWYFQYGVTGLALLTGQVSGGVVAIDFDDGELRGRWMDQHPDLADATPMTNTARGGHLLVRCAEPVVSGRIAENVDVKGEGGYAVLPPSRRDRKSSYTWWRRPSSGIESFGTVAELAEAVGLPIRRREGGALAADPKPTIEVPLDNERDYPTTGEWGLRHHRLSEKELRRIIAATLPSGPGERNQGLGKLARRLARCPRMVADADAREGVVREWHAEAVAVCRTRNVDTTLRDFRGWWEGTDPAKVSPQPDGDDRAAAEAMLPPDKRWLASSLAVAVHLHRRTGGGTFFLSHRMLGESIGVDHRAAGGQLNRLLELKRLAPAGTHPRGERLANEYRLAMPIPTGLVGNTPHN